MCRRTSCRSSSSGSHGPTRRAAAPGSASRSRAGSRTRSARTSPTSRPSRTARVSCSCCLRSLACDRQLDRERRAAPPVGGDPDPAVHAVHELAADVEAEAGAADAAGQVRVEPEELLEDSRLLGRRDAETLVFDAEADPASRLSSAGSEPGRRRASTSPRCRAGSSGPVGACPGPLRPAAARPARRPRARPRRREWARRATITLFDELECVAAHDRDAHLRPSPGGSPRGCR